MLEEVHRHALAEYPDECCGIIIGKVGDHSEDVLFRCTNIQNKLHEMDPKIHTRDARTAFHIDPRELMKILKEAEKRALAVKVFYHSHPEHDAYFSEEDKRMALFGDEPTYPDARHLVVSVYGGAIKNSALFFWNPDNKAFEPQ